MKKTVRRNNRKQSTSSVGSSNVNPFAQLATYWETFYSAFAQCQQLVQQFGSYVQSGESYSASTTQAGSRKGTLADRIVGYLSTTPADTRTIIKAVGGNQSTVYQAISRLKRSGVITKDDKGHFHAASTNGSVHTLPAFNLNQQAARA